MTERAEGAWKRQGVGRTSPTRAPGLCPILGFPIPMHGHDRVKPEAGNHVTTCDSTTFRLTDYGTNLPLGSRARHDIFRIRD